MKPKEFDDRKLIYSVNVKLRTGETKLLEAYGLSVNGMGKLQKLSEKVQKSPDNLYKVAEELKEMMVVLFGGNKEDYGEFTVGGIQKIIVGFYQEMNAKVEENQKQEADPTSGTSHMN